MVSLFLVRYGELALKSAPVRREFESTLRRNILDLFVAAGLTARLRSDHGHFYVEVDDPKTARRVLGRVFGVTSFSEAFEVPTEIPTLTARFLELAGPRLPEGASFAVRARRTGTHPFTSQQLAGDLGGAVLDRFASRHLRVDLGSPDVELHVEVRGPRSYLYFDRDSGPGGLPLGVAGRLVALLDGPRGGLGAYLMMKRGCRVGLVTADTELADSAETLRRFDPRATVEVVGREPTDWVEGVARLAERTHADGVVLPISVEEYPAARERWGDRVLFSPTVGLTEEEVVERWQSVVARAS